ncbi:unnamed protein product [Ectocarpus sp. 6 AP-2014]
MAHLTRNVFQRGAASSGLPLATSILASGANVSRSMSTSWVARSAGSLLGRHSVKVKGDSVQKMNQAMDEIERRERMLRVPEIMERHRYHEKGYNRTRRQKSGKIWRNEFKAATKQLQWMTLLKEKGVPIPGQKGRR